MYLKLDALQSRTEEWIKESWNAGKWSPNSIISADGAIIDPRLKLGLIPTPLTRDLTWGVPVPSEYETEDQGMKGKVLCACHTFIMPLLSVDAASRCLG